MRDNSYGIIGFGRLGRALAQGLLNSGVRREELLVCAKSEQTRALAETEFGISATGESDDVLKRCRIGFLVLKKSVFAQLRPCDALGATIISCMAGVTISELRQKFPEAGGIIRAMPTVSIASRSGIVGLTRTDDAEVKSLLSGLGDSFEVSEEDIEKVTAYSACGLGFAAYLMRSVISAGMSLGFDAETAERSQK